MTNLAPIVSDSFEAVFCCHALEHLYPYQVPLALSEFLRVLKPDGAVMILVPDLEDVKPDVKPLAEDTVLGPICGLDMFYGHHAVLEHHPFMAHHCGFIASVLHDALTAAGFEGIETKRMTNYHLCGTGKKANGVHSG